MGKKNYPRGTGRLKIVYAEPRNSELEEYVRVERGTASHLPRVVVRSKKHGTIIFKGTNLRHCKWAVGAWKCLVHK